MQQKLKKVFARLDSLQDEMVEVLKGCIRNKAVGPTNGGVGEKAKADYIEGILRKWGIKDIERIDVPDPSVPSGSRPNIIARMKGTGKRTLWIITHMDVVPAGDLAAWSSDPFEPVVKDGKVIGRGSEDNGQDLVASLFARRALMEEGLVPAYELALMFSADEETGSVLGIKEIFAKRPELFKKDDLVIVPDAPTPDGEMIEVAEKSILWLKVTTLGEQCHGSTPEKGINAHKSAAKYITLVDEELYSKFKRKDDIFIPPVSTFEVTKKENNVPSVNIIPGEDVVYFDNRVLPCYTTDEVLAVYKEVAAKVESETGVKFKFQEVQREEAASPTSPKDDISRLTERCAKIVYGNNPYFGGIGGGTYAATFRKKGIPAVVWGKGDEVAHQPNEYCYIANLVGDAKVFAAMALMDLSELKKAYKDPSFEELRKCK
jgi:succinyl-diaminopimelate desuccinylase